MTKKDYELIAEVFLRHKKRYGGRTDSVTDEIICDMADALEDENPKFARGKFLQATGYNAVNIDDYPL